MAYLLKYGQFAVYEVDGTLVASHSEEGLPGARDYVEHTHDPEPGYPFEETRADHCAFVEDDCAEESGVRVRDVALAQLAAGECPPFFVGLPKDKLGWGVWRVDTQYIAAQNLAQAIAFHRAEWSAEPESADAERCDDVYDEETDRTLRQEAQECAEPLPFMVSWI